MFSPHFTLEGSANFLPELHIREPGLPVRGERNPTLWLIQAGTRHHLKIRGVCTAKVKNPPLSRILIPKLFAYLDLERLMLLYNGHASYL